MVLSNEDLPPLPPNTVDNRVAMARVTCHYTRPAKIDRFDADHIKSVVESTGAFKCEVRPDNSVLIIEKKLSDNPKWSLNQRISDSITTLPETLTAVEIRDILVTFELEPRPGYKDDGNAPVVLRRDTTIHNS